MKILYVIPAIAQGGIEQMVFIWIKGMIELGHECEVFATSTIFSEKSPLLQLHVPLHSCPLSGVNYLHTKKEIRRFLSTNHYDVIHGNVSFLNGVFAEVVHKSTNSTIFVSHAHLNSKRRCSSLLSQVVNDLSHLWFKYLIRKYSNLNIACSNKSGQFLFGENNYVFLPNAVDTSLFKFDLEKRTRLRAEFSMEDDLVIMHVGRFSEEKNHLFLINVFSKLCSINEHSKLLLFGDGALKEQIKETVELLKLSDKVVFMGFRNNVNDFYNAADVFILPSKIEGFPVSLVEAQTNGLPCVASTASPEECNISGLIIFLSLSDSNMEWCKTILAQSRFSEKSRPEFYDIISSTNFNSNKSSGELIKIYDSLLYKLQ